MANDLINIKEDAAPTKKLASQSFTRGVDTVHQEETVIGDGTNNGRIVAVTAASALKVDGSAVNQPVTDAGGALTVDAIDLDIRNLTHVASQDSVRIGDGTDLALVTAAGEQNVLATAQPGVDIGDVTINNASGASAVNIQDGGNSLTVDQATAANLNAQVVGEVAHDAVDSGNPQKMGGQARQTNPTAVADADRVNFIADDVGRQVVVLSGVRDLATDGGAITISTTTETTILAQVASTFLDLVLLIITNTSATATRVDIRDTTGGTVRFSVAIAANGGAVIPFNVPLKQATVNTNWTAQLSTAVTDIRIMAQAVKNI